MRYKINAIEMVIWVALTWFLDGNAAAQTIIRGKIWSGADTVKLGENNAPDSLSSDVGDTSETKTVDNEIDWSSGKIIELPKKNISSKTNLLKLILSIPPTLKFITDAPMELAAHSSDTLVAAIGECDTGNPKKPLVFPLSLNRGKADIFLYYKVICCTTGPKEACYFKEARLRIPVTVGDYDNDVLEIRHEID